MSEMEVSGTCPHCGHDDIFIFSGSGSKGRCGVRIPSYKDVKGSVISYNG